MRYFGSKASAVKYVYNLVSGIIPSGTFCDPFGGIGTVGAYFKRKGYSVWCGDKLTFAHYFQIARVERNRIPVFKQLRAEQNLNSSAEVIDLLNREPPKKDWFTKEYAQKRRFFTEHNAAHIEVCRSLIAEWAEKKWISKSEHAILLASLINSMDKVANTAGTYYAYLKTWYRKALHPFRFDLLPYTKGCPECHSSLCEAKDLVALRDFDILYLDPPYNERSYSAYYHLPETIALEEIPEIHGKSGMPDTVRHLSDFNKAGKARRALEEIMENSRFRLMVFHYSKNGLITPEEIRSILAQYGQLEESIVESKGYTTAKISRVIKHHLYLVYND